MNLVLVSSNIRFNNPEDGGNSWPHRRSILSQLLLSHDPHIIATQEGRKDQLKEFEELLLNYTLIDHHREWIPERMYPSFFIKKDLFSILSTQDHWLSETPKLAGSLSFGSAFPRLMTTLHVRPAHSSEELMIVNTHLDHIKPQTRLEQIKVLTQELKNLKKDHLKLIIMGDFNDGPESEIRTHLLTHFPRLQDSWSVFNSHEESSHHSFIGSNPSGSRIDWILVDRSIGIESCFLEKNSIEGKYPSDHFPVVCKIKL